MDTKATFICPECGDKQKVKMPTDRCQHFYQCTKCKKTIQPSKEDCCVFCSYADKKCPMKKST